MATSEITRPPGLVISRREGDDGAGRAGGRLTGVECPYCGSQMSAGRMAVISLTVAAPITVVWKSSEQEHDGSQKLLSPGLLNRRTRPALYCYGCDATVLEPLEPLEPLSPS